MLIDLKDKKGNNRRIHEEELFRIGHFKTIQDLSKVAVGTTVKGTWSVALTSGDKIDVVGTLKNYDALLKILIHRTVASKKKPREYKDEIVK